MNPFIMLFKRTNDLIDKDMDTGGGHPVYMVKAIACIILLVVFALATIIGIIALIDWHWWLGLPLLCYVVYRLVRFVFTDEPER